MLTDLDYNPAAVHRAFEAGLKELTGERTLAERLVVARLPRRRRRHQDQLHRRPADLVVARLHQRDDRRPQERGRPGERHRHLGPHGPRLPPDGTGHQPGAERGPGPGLFDRMGGRRALGPRLRPGRLRLLRGRDAPEVPGARGGRLHQGGVAPRDLQLRHLALDAHRAGRTRRRGNTRRRSAGSTRTTPTARASGGSPTRSPASSTASRSRTRRSPSSPSIVTKDITKLVNIAVLKHNEDSGVTWATKNIALGVTTNKVRFHIDYCEKAIPEILAQPCHQGQDGPPHRRGGQDLDGQRRRGPDRPGQPHLLQPRPRGHGPHRPRHPRGEAGGPGARVDPGRSRRTSPPARKRGLGTDDLAKIDYRQIRVKA